MPSQDTFRQGEERHLSLHGRRAPASSNSYDFKPALQKYNHQPVPDSLMAGKRFAFMDSFAKDTPKLLGTSRAFKQHGKQRRLGIGPAAPYRERRPTTSHF